MTAYKCLVILTEFRTRNETLECACRLRVVEGHVDWDHRLFQTVSSNGKISSTVWSGTNRLGYVQHTS
jgi:hypothetical protein